MAASKRDQYWTLIIIFLAAVIAIGSIVAWSGYSRSQSIEISIPPTPELQGEIYVGGAVSNPGFYPLKAEDSIEVLIQAAGGTNGSADSDWLKLYVPQAGEGEQPQKINLNRAEAWLLEALEGIGETRAEDIVAYRQRNGLFSNIQELTRVNGIGTATYEKIKHLITVAD